jgi:hypothetical protein
MESLIRYETYDGQFVEKSISPDSFYINDIKHTNIKNFYLIGNIRWFTPLCSFSVENFYVSDNLSILRTHMLNITNLYLQHGEQNYASFRCHENMNIINQKFEHNGYYILSTGIKVFVFDSIINTSPIKKVDIKNGVKYLNCSYGELKEIYIPASVTEACIEYNKIKHGKLNFESFDNLQYLSCDAEAMTDEIFTECIKHNIELEIFV